MSRRVGRKFLTATAILALVVGGSLFFIKDALAATGSIYLTPANSTVDTGSTITVSVRINPSTNINGVQATVNFDATKLQYVSVDASGSAFTTQLQQTQSAGSVTMVRGDLTGFVSADSLVETVTFKALAGSGSTALTLSSANATDGNGDYTDPNTTGAGISFSTPVTPPATCPSGQIGTPPNCTTPSSGGTTTPPATGSSGKSSGGATTNTSTNQPASTPAGSTKVTVAGKKISYTTAVISTTSPDPTQVYIRYGIGDKLNLQTPVSDFATSHIITLDPTLLVPGLTYSYVIVATNQQGIVSQSAPAQFKTTGLKLKVSISDSNHKSLSNKTIMLHSTPVTAKTDANGVATFDGVSPGTHHVIYTAGKKTYDQAVTVVNDVQASGTTQTAETQNFSVVYGFAQSDAHMTLWIWICIIILIIGTIVALGQTGRLGFALQLHRNPGVPLKTQAVIISNTTSGTLHADKSDEPKPGLNKEVVQEHLNAIPNPSTPTPGSTIAPKTDSTEPTDEESTVER